jgi:hypothetical protein
MLGPFPRVNSLFLVKRDATCADSGSFDMDQSGGIYYSKMYDDALNSMGSR